MNMDEVIKGLEEAETMLAQAVDRGGEMAVMGAFKCYNHVSDAIALLKEQEAVEPKVEKAILDYQSWHYICGDCGGQIDINDNYCRHCGRVVAHLSNKI